MKLYATVTSERASKGQGGNEFLEIVITDSDKKERFTIDLVVIEDTVVIQTHGAGVMRRSFELPTKGKKQKGETCLTCGNGGWLSKNERCLNCNPMGNH